MLCRRRFALPLLTALTGLSVAACPQQIRAPIETAAADVLVSDEEEATIGEQLHDELSKEVQFVDDPVITPYVQRVAEPILQAAREQRPELPWALHVIDDPEMVNAMAAPGGKLYVFTGLLLALDNETELAGVLAHEVAHVTERHGVRRLVSALGLETLASLALGQNPGVLRELAASILGTGVLLAHSRADESEADRLGAQVAAQANYDPQGLTSFLAKIQKLEGDTPGPIRWLASHPSPERRIEELQAFIQKNQLSGRSVGGASLAPVKDAIRARPAPMKLRPKPAPQPAEPPQPRDEPGRPGR